MPRSLKAILLFLGMTLSLWAQDTTVILLRHAERLSMLDEDSSLSQTGQARSQGLVPLLSEFHPTWLYASNQQRTQQTLAPTAAKLGLVPLLRPKADSAALAAEILRGHRGQTVLVCWHHDLMKPLAKALGWKGPVPHWSLFTYDRLWILRINPKGEVSLEERIQEFESGKR